MTLIKEKDMTSTNKDFYALATDGRRYIFLKHIDHNFSWFYWENDQWRQCLIPGAGKILISTHDVDSFNLQVAHFCEKYLTKDFLPKVTK